MDMSKESNVYIQGFILIFNRLEMKGGIKTKGFIWKIVMKS